jgi:hypothetical protein
MSKLGKTVALLLILSGLSGCGESSHAILHDLLVFWNEVCDNMVRATDEAAAKQIFDTQFKVLSRRYEKEMKPRCEQWYKDINKEKAQDIENAMLDYWDELFATFKRMNACEERLKEIIAKTDDHVYLEKIMNWSDTKKNFNKTQMGDYDSNKKEIANPVKQADNGLVPPRPQLDQTKKKKSDK